MPGERPAARPGHEAEPQRRVHRRPRRRLDDAAVGREGGVERSQRVAVRIAISGRGLADQPLHLRRIVGQALGQPGHAQARGQGVLARVVRRAPAVDEDQGRSLHGVEGARAERGIVGRLRCGRGREFERREGGETGVFPGLHAGARQPVGAAAPRFRAERVEPRQAVARQRRRQARPGCRIVEGDGARAGHGRVPPLRPPRSARGRSRHSRSARAPAQARSRRSGRCARRRAHAPGPAPRGRGAADSG